MGSVVQGKALVRGTAKGKILRTEEPLSFWGGYDPETGEIVDRRHPLSGVSGRGRVLLMPRSRGSSTTSAVLLEAIRTGSAPAAIVVSVPDTFVALAGVVAEELYGRTIPIVAVHPDDLAALGDGVDVHIDREGAIVIS